MNRKPSIYNDSLVQKVLIEPITIGADKLIVVSGYASHNMASWHIKKINESKLPSITISLTVGMCQRGGIRQDIHDGLRDLVSLRDSKYSKLDCKYIYQGAPVHSKVYIWLKGGIPIKAYSGSANYTTTGFSNVQREYMSECDPQMAYDYYLSLEDDSIICNHGEIAEHVLITKSQVNQEEDNHTLFTKEHISLSLLTKDGDVGYGSGLHWGHRRNGTKREPNQAYIRVPAKVARTGFFPLNKKHFSVITDDQKQLILRIEQDGDKAITTPLNNSLLGEYFRGRIGVANGAFVEKEHLEQYGRTDVTFYKIDDEQYYMDFSVK